MKTIQNTLTVLKNTYHAIKLLSNPEVSQTLHKELNKKYPSNPRLLGKNDLFVHKHFMVQVVG